jgi:hypothetical protein
MIVRERMSKKAELTRIKKQNAVDVQKGRRVNRKAEEGKVEDALRVQALDRSYPEVLSRSPLKKRIPYPVIEGEIREHHGTIVNRTIVESTTIEVEARGMSTPNRSRKQFSPYKSNQSNFQTTAKTKAMTNTGGTFKTP